MKQRLKAFFTPVRIFALTLFACIILALISFFSSTVSTVLRTGLDTIIVPMQKGINSLGGVIYDHSVNMATRAELEAQVEDLTSQIEDLQAENQLLQQDAYELSRLRSLYALDEQYASWPKTAARVIGSGSDNWDMEFTIDKGSDDGMRVDMNVISGNGLVGIITEVYPNRSVVRSIIEDNSYVSGMLSSSGEICSVQGDITLMESGKIRVTDFSADTDVKAGDEIVTSNISDKYLQGILIGTVSEISVDDSQITKSGTITPAADFENLQEVLVITTTKADLTGDNS
ncbi:MAG: rod shape-determining protein MreC [Lachnospiraceae bacterium]|jgi:rod shape-determining protein MreC|nr:rod shape-determining protein MreC [Lachnospiraceae bacterium]MCH4030462.1 rod shape-determining protein MreC [Lachnospiraceae bacterium]MCH4069672.1 rod shape-determining protein MreC [Lachnospiraceae bacterium]MCH4107390.1 rod shape-determining protein MreC [Lachnospiraceae bacterium]MCI1301756.1 rod shape-determining protein MreC [Lachnospiraceae bacterium]